MSLDILKMLVESACAGGTISEQDKNLLQKKASDMNINQNQLDALIQDCLSNNQNDMSSGFVTSSDTSEKSVDQSDSSGFITSNDESTQFVTNTKAPDVLKTSNPLSTKVNKPVKPQSLFTDVSLLDGQGAMSVVQRGKLHGKWIIIKRVKPEFQDNTKYKELFYKEFENAYLLDHSNIVRLLDKGEDDEGAYYTMEFIDGRTLSKMITNEGIKDKKLVKKLFAQMLDALSYVHKKQIYHRDLKPDNILVTFKGDNAKILDFGLAAADSFEDDLVKVGTPKYAAPEQRNKGNQIDQRADIYALGLIFLEMLTGNISKNSINLIENMNYRHIVDKCSMENPEDRFYDCDDILDWLNKPEVLAPVEKIAEKPIEKSEPIIEQKPIEEIKKTADIPVKNEAPLVVKKDPPKIEDENEVKFQQLKKQADEKFAKKDFTNALTLYQSANSLKPGNTIVEQQIDKCLKALAEKNKTINAVAEPQKKSFILPIGIAAGVILLLVLGFLFKDKLFSGASNTDNTENTTDNVDKFNYFRKQADGHMKSNDYLNAKINYDSALVYKAKDTETIDLKKKAERLLYLYEQADGLFKDKNIARSRVYYDSIINLQTNDDAAKKQFEKCNEIIDKAKNLKTTKEAGSEKFGYADQDNNIVIDYQFTGATNFNGGLAAVQNNQNKWAAIGMGFLKKPEFLTEFKYDRARIQDNGFLFHEGGTAFAMFLQGGQLVTRRF